MKVGKFPAVARAGSLPAKSVKLQTNKFSLFLRIFSLPRDKPSHNNNIIINNSNNILLMAEIKSAEFHMLIEFIMI